MTSLFDINRHWQTRHAARAGVARPQLWFRDPRWASTILLGCLSISCDGLQSADEPGQNQLASPLFETLPLHVAAIVEDAPDLTISTATTINTSALTINGATNAYFVSQPPYAVLFVDALDIAAPVYIGGGPALIVVATDKIRVGASIDLHANKTSPGPGISTAGIGGDGGEYNNYADIRVSSGGGGGGYGSPGGKGTEQQQRSKQVPWVAGGSGGATYGGSPTDPLIGGSKGGRGGGLGPVGGAGGGALQLSSAVAIEVSAVINAGGGGGLGDGPWGGAGAGGGAGGEILLEAPTVTMLDGGLLAANGGGGGGGGNFHGSTMGGLDGSDGLPSTARAVGGAGGIPQGQTGATGAGGTYLTFAGAGGGGFGNSLGGGGGGGAGRIFVRHSASTSPNLLLNAISPPVILDDTLAWTPVPADPCFTADNGWQNHAVLPQAGGFQLELDATPSTTGLDAVIALTNVIADEFNDLAPTIRFNPAGVIDVRNNTAYSALVSYPWSAGTTYHFLVSINLLGTQPRYAVDVRTGAGAYVRIADNYAFRGQQINVRRLTNLATKIDAPTGGTLQVCASAPVQAPPSGCTAVTAGGILNIPLTSATSIADVTLKATPSTDLIDAEVGLSSGAASASTDFATSLRYSLAGRFDALDDATYRANATRGVSGTSTIHVVADLSAHTYTATVSDGSTTSTIASGYLFQSTQSAVGQLDNLALRVNDPTGALTVCGVTTTP